MRPWVVASIALLAAAAFVPVQWPAAAPAIQRAAPLLSLFFFLAAVGHWLRLGRRSFLAAGTLTGIVYALTAWGPATFGYDDFFIVALLSSFLVFALAGFNLVFIVEEAVFDLHRIVRLDRAGWRFGPTLAVFILAAGLPWLPAWDALWSLWIASLVSTVLMGGWWFVRAFNTIREGPVLRELHILVVSVMLMAASIDGVRLAGAVRGFLLPVIGYVLLVATWLYVSYTTLHRTSLLLRARNGVPWLLIMLSASFALVEHALLHYRVEQGLGVTVLLNQRLAYLVVGMGIGMAFYLAQASWRLLQNLRDDRRFSPRGRIIAGRMARVAEDVFLAEQRIIEGTAYQIYTGVDSLWPGRRRGWELDASGRLSVFEEE